MSGVAPDVTQLLVRWRQGDRAAVDELMPIVYQELRRVARRCMRGERGGHVLQTTALVHEAYLRLVGLDLAWRDRVHFFAMAARLMRRVLVDLARERDAAKRGGGRREVTLEETRIVAPAATKLLDLDRAMDALERVDERKCRVVELRCFAGMTIDETAEALGVSHTTVEKDFKFAKAWLARALESETRAPPPAS